jgi:hypothetical protein
VSRFSHTRQIWVGLLLLVTLVMLAATARAELVNGEDLIDPTAPFLLRADSNAPLLNVFATFNNYEVSSILIRPNLRLAVVNSQRVRVGDSIGNAEIVNIEQDRVTINLEGETRELMLHGGSIKTMSGTP